MQKALECGLVAMQRAHMYVPAIGTGSKVLTQLPKRGRCFLSVL